ncbi:MAG: SGNH/GDSL hydrolase family protein [Deltaproteobacteria bacterium]|nr:SGNH/GDSL hydrolase family protein [Deltaproteobacteria bacterium]
MRLLVRGGSIPAGVGVTRSYVDMLGRFCASRGVELINRSRPYENSFDGIRSFHEDIDPFRPEILLLHFGIDDAFCPVYRSEFKENLVRIVRLARERFDPLIIMPTSHTFDSPHDTDALNIYYRAIREVCQDLSCEMIPFHIFWAGHLEDQGLRNRELLQQDERYPNEKGHAVYAGTIMRRLERIIPTVLSGPCSNPCAPGQTWYKDLQ